MSGALQQYFIKVYPEYEAEFETSGNPKGVGNNAALPPVGATIEGDAPDDALPLQFEFQPHCCCSQFQLPGPVAEITFKL